MIREELLKKIDFEKSWLYDCGIFGSDVDIAFHAIKNKVIEALEQYHCEMTAEDYRQRMMQAFHNSDCDELIAVCVLPTEKEFEHLEGLLKNHYKKEPCEDVVSRQAVIDEIEFYQINPQHFDFVSLIDSVKDLPSVNPQKSGWIPVSERLPETDNKNSINSFNVLLWVKYKKYPEKKAQIYLGKLKRIDGDDGSGNFWGIKTETCEWTIWGWSYFYEPEVIAWMPLPEPYKESEDKE